MSRHITHFRRTALGATAPFACTALAACGATTEMPANTYSLTGNYSACQSCIFTFNAHRILSSASYCVTRSALRSKGNETEDWVRRDSSPLAASRRRVAACLNRRTGHE